MDKDQNQEEVTVTITFGNNITEAEFLEGLEKIIGKEEMKGVKIISCKNCCEEEVVTEEGLVIETGPFPPRAKSTADLPTEI